MRGKLGLVLKGRAMLSKSLIQFSVDGRGCVPSLISYLRRNYDEVNEDNGGLLQKVPCRHCCTQGPQPCSGPLLTHASARGSWTCVGKSGSVSCGVTAPFSWVLLKGAVILFVPSKILFVPSKSLFPQSCVSSGSSVVGLMATSFKRAYARPRSTAPRAPAPAAVHC